MSNVSLRELRRSIRSLVRTPAVAGTSRHGKDLRSYQSIDTHADTLGRDSAPSIDTRLLRPPAAYAYERYAKPIDTLIALAILVVLIAPESRNVIPLGWETALSVHVKLKNVAFLCLFVALWTPLLSVCGLYHVSAERSPLRTLSRATIGCGVGATLIALFTVLTDSTTRPFPTIVAFWLAASVATASAHWLIQGVAWIVRSFARNPARRNVIVVGSNARAASHARALAQEPGCTVIGFVDQPWDGADAMARDKWLGSVDELERILMYNVVDEVVVALPMSCHVDIERTIRACERLGVESKCIVDYFRPVFASQFMSRSGDYPAVAMVVVQSDARRLVKRAFDIVAASIALLLLAPIMAAIAVAIKLSGNAPVLFTQERYGYQKRRFQMYKFRSMVNGAEQMLAQLESLNEAEGPVFKIRNDPRVTRLGRILRRTSLDELPQLFNVIKGDMSLVGPRPLAARDVDRFDEPWLMRRFSVLPGLTCIWQISGRSTLSFDDWITLDLDYIDNWTLRLDFEILIRTIPAVLRCDGAM